MAYKDSQNKTADIKIIRLIMTSQMNRKMAEQICLVLE